MDYSGTTGIYIYILERVKVKAFTDAYDSFKKDYENRIKSDLVAMLTEIQLEIEELNTPPTYQDEDYFLIGTNKCSELIQQKIDKYKAESEDKKVDCI